MLWSLLQEKLEREDLLLKKVGKIALAICYSNKDQQTIKFIIEKFSGFLCPEDFTKALYSKDDNWPFDVLCRLTRSAKSETFGIFWSLLQDNISEKDLKLVFLTKERLRIMYFNMNAFVASAYYKDKSMIEIGIKTARSLLCVEDFVKALKSEDENWIIDILCRHANFSESDVFKMFWSYLLENLNEAELKSVFLQKNRKGINAFMASAQNPNKATIEFIINLATIFYKAEDFTKALAPESDKWVVQVLCEYVETTETASFEKLWSF